jgi:DNA-directed RNA polymerase alpha subunit
LHDLTFDRLPKRLAQSVCATSPSATLSGMGKAHFTAAEAHTTGERIGIDWPTSPFDVEQFRVGMDVELEHGTQDLETNVTDDDVTVTAKIARAHLNEFPDYYSRLAVMEAEAETYWAVLGE